ncbi:MAG: hypothetical protein JWQ21_694 [Herminiimonas sp.]|nr:hypothetical protein [Herminiimonas sp.]
MTGVYDFKAGSLTVAQKRMERFTSGMRLKRDRNN